MIEFLLHIIINIIISIFIIYIIHSTWEYFKDTYTNKKTKDLVNTQITKYQQMMEEMQQNTKSESISKTDIQTMNDDLTLFMEQQPTE
jgi:TRAP-type C4-dicarboxylate transport system permease small subunit